MAVSLKLLVTLLLFPSSSSFLWSLFGNQGCNCCRCPSNSFSSMNQNFFNPHPFHNSFQYAMPPTYQQAPVFKTFTYSSKNDYSIAPLYTTTQSYRGPPAAAPVYPEQLYKNDLKYSTNQVAYHTEILPVTAVEYGDHALTQLEEELAAEKYKYNLQKEQERKQKKKQKQNRIRVFKIKPHKANTGMVEWQSSQVAKYTNEKAVSKFIEAAESNDVNEDDLEEFIPIEIGSEPELAAEEPAGPPPNVRNKISHDPVLSLRNRFVLT